METSGPPKFLGNPGGHCPCSTTPVGPDAPCGTKCDAPDAAPACVQDEGSTQLVISGLNHTTFDLAVYASQGGSPHHHARLASGCWPGFTRRDSYPQGSNERFPSSSLFLLSRALPDAMTPAPCQWFYRLDGSLDLRGVSRCMMISLGSVLVGGGAGHATSPSQSFLASSDSVNQTFV